MFPTFLTKFNRFQLWHYVLKIYIGAQPANLTRCYFDLELLSQYAHFEISALGPNWQGSTWLQTWGLIYKKS